MDVLLDVRQRRGMRGGRYSFANARALEAGLAARGIDYRYIPELAPSTPTRALQRRADEQRGTSKSVRAALDPAFVEAYERDDVAGFDWQALVRALQPRRSPAVFCVERAPQACHRSIVARRLASAASVQVIDLAP